MIMIKVTLKEKIMRDYIETTALCKDTESAEVQ